jgi:hypothetical protein
MVRAGPQVYQDAPDAPAIVGSFPAAGQTPCPVTDAGDINRSWKIDMGRVPASASRR